MSKRKNLGNKVRFEVFKRDGFCCQYCGQSAPDVVLEVDHISPVSKGGDNDILNLVTSCWECNSGKGARELDDDSVLAKQRQQLQDLTERREQLEMMLRWREGLAGVKGQAVEAYEQRLSERTGFGLSDYGRKEARKLLRKFTAVEVLDALDVAIDEYGEDDGDGNLTQESVRVVLSKVGGIAFLSNQPQGERDLYYIRAILRNRLSYLPEWRAIKLLRVAVEAGAPIQDLKDLAKDCTSWTRFTEEIEYTWGVSE